MCSTKQPAETLSTDAKEHHLKKEYSVAQTITEMNVRFLVPKVHTFSGRHTELDAHDGIDNMLEKQ